MSVLPKIDGVQFKVNHVKKLHKKNDSMCTYNYEKEDNLYYSYFRDLSVERSERKNDKSLRSDLFRIQQRLAQEKTVNKSPHKLKIIPNHPNKIYKYPPSKEKQFSKSINKDSNKYKHIKTLSYNCNQTTAHSSLIEEKESWQQSHDKDINRKKKHNKSLCIKAKESLKNFLDLCKKEESLGIQISHEINKSLLSRNCYYDLSNPFTIKRDKAYRNFSNLINDDHKASISFLTKNRNILFTRGPDKIKTNYYLDLRPDTIFKFKNIIKEKYGEEAMIGEKKKIIDNVPMYMVNNPLTKGKLNKVIEIKIKKLPNRKIKNT